MTPLTVTQLTQAIKLNLESSFPNIYLQGEISNFKLQTSGHLYFSLKDSNAQISVVMFKADASALKTIPKAGDQVIVKGEINVYPAKGNYQLIIRELSYVGLGELLLKLEQLKIKLHQKGWFKTSRKKPLPRFPKRIGVVTSPTGAVIQDILNILSRRYSGFHLILNPVKVQGEGAAEEIAKAIQQFNTYDLVDVMIIGRGGGSLEDLWAFNEEVVAEAIYHSKIPIISAVGHETDHCIADYVADVRAPTPSAAAEMVIAEKNQQLEYLDTLKKRMKQTVSHHLAKYRQQLLGISRHPLILHPKKMIEFRMQWVDDQKADLALAIQQYLRLKRHQLDAYAKQTVALRPDHLLQRSREQLSRVEQNIHQKLNAQIHLKKQQMSYTSKHFQHSAIAFIQRKKNEWLNKQWTLTFDRIINEDVKERYQKLSPIILLLKALDPKNLLRKGYSILFAKNEEYVINSVEKLNKGQEAELLLSDGKVLITVSEIIQRD